jgi:hypothetical protein
MDKKKLRVMNCAFWFHSRCYNPEPNKILSARRGTEVKHSFCFGKSKAKYCPYFTERKSKQPIESATQPELF